jgi:hypothetical protein
MCIAKALFIEGHRNRQAQIREDLGNRGDLWCWNTEISSNRNQVAICSLLRALS